MSDVADIGNLRRLVLRSVINERPAATPTWALAEDVADKVVEVVARYLERRSCDVVLNDAKDMAVACALQEEADYLRGQSL